MISNIFAFEYPNLEPWSSCLFLPAAFCLVTFLLASWFHIPIYLNIFASQYIYLWIEYPSCCVLLGHFFAGLMVSHLNIFKHIYIPIYLPLIEYPNMGPWSSCLFLPAVFCFVTPQCSESRTQKLGHWDVFFFIFWLFCCFGESLYTLFI